MLAGRRAHAGNGHMLAGVTCLEAAHVGRPGATCRIDCTWPAHRPRTKLECTKPAGMWPAGQLPRPQLAGRSTSADPYNNSTAAADVPVIRQHGD